MTWNQVKVRLKAKPDNVKINGRKVQSCPELSRVCKGVNSFWQFLMVYISSQWFSMVFAYGASWVPCGHILVLPQHELVHSWEVHADRYTVVGCKTFPCLTFQWSLQQFYHHPILQLDQPLYPVLQDLMQGQLTKASSVASSMSRIMPMQLLHPSSGPNMLCQLLSPVISDTEDPAGDQSSIQTIKLPEVIEVVSDGEELVNLQKDLGLCSPYSVLAISHI